MGGHGVDADGPVGIEQLRSRMQDMGIGTAHNTLANEEEETKEENTTNASSNPSDRERSEQLAQLSVMLQNRTLKVVSGATPMNTQGHEDQQRPAQ